MRVHTQTLCDGRGYKKVLHLPSSSESGDLDQQSTGSGSSKKRKYEQHELTAFAGSVGTAVTAATVEKCVQAICGLSSTFAYILQISIKIVYCTITLPVSLTLITLCAIDCTV